MKRLETCVLAAGLTALVLAVTLSPRAAIASATQVWPAFVLVTGLLLLGLAAASVGLFDTLGQQVVRVAPSAMSLFLVAIVMVTIVTALLNLDTSVVFVTPILLLAAERLGADDRPVLYLSVMLANGASLFLPGSNLTNLIVLNGRHVSGWQFARHMFMPALLASLGVSVIVGVRFFVLKRDRPQSRPRAVTPVERTATKRSDGAFRQLVVLITVLAAVAVVLVFPSGMSAPLVVALGLGATAWLLILGQTSAAHITYAVNPSVLIGLFGLTVALATVGRHLASHLTHSSPIVTSIVGGATSIIVNNLPASGLLGSRAVPHPFALLIGLNLGPNLAVTGALSAALWFRVARRCGSQPSVKQFSLLGCIVAPVSIALALGGLLLVG